MRSLFSANPIKTPLFRLARSHLRFTSAPPTRRSMAIPPKPGPLACTEDGLARKFWIKFRRESMFAKYSPFALALASGSLKIESFRHYIAQDVHFLKAFAQAVGLRRAVRILLLKQYDRKEWYELAEECADDDDEKLAISQLRKGVVEELKMHDSFVQEWGSDLVKECPVNSATLKYADFLLATASGKVGGVKAPGKLATPFEKTKVAAYTIGAMTPCMRLYAFLGKEFEALHDHNEGEHPYKKWINSYSSENFQASALQTEDLLDKLSVPLTGEELDIMEKLYHQAMKLEIEFFYAQPLVQPTVAPLTRGHNPAEDRLMIFCDFDLTCTVVDSSAILAEIAIVTAPKSDQSQPEGLARMSSAELRNTWGLLSTQYTEEYEQCIESIMPPEKVGFNYEALYQALQQLSDFEKKANSRVIESGVLKGLNVEDIKRAGERLILQDGCRSFFQTIVKKENLNSNIHVLSYCWCGDLIRAAFSSGDLHLLKVHANEFKFEETMSTGDIDRKVESPIDKIEAFNRILNEYRCESGRKNVTVYIGDSVGDLLCLLEADIGIVIGSSSSLRRVGSEYGISFVPLLPGLVKKQKECVGGSFVSWKGRSGILYTVSSWDEIHAFILGW